MKKFSLALMIASLMPAHAALAQAVPLEASSKAPSGLNLPRFVSISASEANMRTGPGDNYPITWVYLREDHPLLVTAEYGAWRRVRDSDGTTGWMHLALLSGRRTAVISGGTRTLFREADPASKPLLLAEEGVIGRLLRCDGQWCRLEIGDQRGWILRDHLWGTFENENVR